MSVDALQERIRKTKNPSVLYFDGVTDWIPPHIRGTAESETAAYGTFCRSLLVELKGLVPAVRFGLGGFSLLGAEGVALLRALTCEADRLGYYVLLDAPGMLNTQTAKQVAAGLLRQDAPYHFDGLIISSYLGTDILKQFLPLCKEGKSLFPIVRTANKSASEVQDLITGGRLVHTAVADLVNRLGEQHIGKCGYSNVGAVASASTADSLRTLRTKYPRLLLLLDGYDYPNANAKNCSFAFDKLGHGAVACASESILNAWQEGEAEDYLRLAKESAERMKKNLTRYITVL
jgi:orotidine-5'-phosphate decarboxylase